jgi:hypothetical protein
MVTLPRLQLDRLLERIGRPAPEGINTIASTSHLLVLMDIVCDGVWHF